MTEAEVLTGAFEEGLKKSVGVASDDSRFVANTVDGDGVPAAGTLIKPDEKPLIPYGPIKSGQIRAHRNTTIFNPNRCSREVEATLGENKYEPVIREDSPEHLKVEQISLQNKIETLEGQIKILTAALSGGKVAETTAPDLSILEKDKVPADDDEQAVLGDKQTENKSPDESGKEPELPVAILVKDMKMPELRNMAKELGIKSFGKKKVELIKLLEEAISADSEETI